MELPSDLSITTVDVGTHETVASLAEGQGELTGLALWLLAERQKVICRTVSLLHCSPQHVALQRMQSPKCCLTQNQGSRMIGRVCQIRTRTRTDYL